LTRGHTEMLRYSSTMSRVLYLRVNRRSIMTNLSHSGQEGFFTSLYTTHEGRQFLRSQRVRLPGGGRSYGMVQPLLLPVRRPFVAICSYEADDVGLVREVQTAKLTIFLYSLVSLFFKDSASLMMNLVCRSKPFGRGLDLRSTAC
jgi:hypothetical protein